MWLVEWICACWQWHTNIIFSQKCLSKWLQISIGGPPSTCSAGLPVKGCGTSMYTLGKYLTKVALQSIRYKQVSPTTPPWLVPWCKTPSSKPPPPPWLVPWCKTPSSKPPWLVPWCKTPSSKPPPPPWLVPWCKTPSKESLHFDLCMYVALTWTYTHEVSRLVEGAKTELLW
jgi:hypothetical protein